ncbi:ABC-type transport auxiliary lipoprotein family protein [Sorangium sp. So ce1182]|uniref:ABC-type transport auxiliary lipoprotein family protein n=1 Tax=Sorangium sp. So ce1182 TaxID=3133334 RepID=UPI003F63102D
MKIAKTLLFALLLSAPGCALTSKAEPLSVRYFTPKWEVAPRAPDRASADGPRLRLGRISSSSHLRQQIVYRSSDVEVAMYDDRRWTEKPEEYVRRALARALFEERPLVQAVSGGGPALDIELLAFDEVHRKDGRAARITLHYAVQDDRTVLDAQSMTVDVEVRGDTDDPENVAAAMGAALHEIAERLASRVASRLTAASPGEAQASAAP